MEARPAAARAAEQDWLTVVTTGAAVPEQVRLSAADGNVQSGDMVGVHLLGARDQVVLFPADHGGSGRSAAVRYVVRQDGVRYDPAEHRALQRLLNQDQKRAA